VPSGRHYATPGFVPASVRVISWRANRVQVDASLDELRVVARTFGQALTAGREPGELAAWA
jgi:uncharacterized membrane protein YjgN (DUF898 family)